MRQLSLWGEGEQEPVVMHNHIKVVWLSGYREIYCAAGTYRPAERVGDWEWEAGFVGFPMLPQECSLCCKRKVKAL